MVNLLAAAIVIKLGAEVRDPISGFRGVVTARTEYLFCTPRVQVATREFDGAKLSAPEWFEESQVEVLSEDWRRGAPAVGFLPS